LRARNIDLQIPVRLAISIFRRTVDCRMFRVSVRPIEAIFSLPFKFKR